MALRTRWQSNHQTGRTECRRFYIYAPWRGWSFCMIFDSSQLSHISYVLYSLDFSWPTGACENNCKTLDLEQSIRECLRINVSPVLCVRIVCFPRCPHELVYTVVFCFYTIEIDFRPKTSCKTDCGLTTRLHTASQNIMIIITTQYNSQ